jgi:hypothetical protein
MKKTTTIQTQPDGQDPSMLEEIAADPQSKFKDLRKSSKSDAGSHFSLLGKREEPLNRSNDDVTEPDTKKLKSEKENAWSPKTLKETNFIKLEGQQAHNEKNRKLKHKQTDCFTQSKSMKKLGKMKEDIVITEENTIKDSLSKVDGENTFEAESRREKR